MASQKSNGNLYTETGLTGLRRSGGHIQEEFLTQLKGYRAISTYREMRDNDPVIGAILYAIDKLVRQVTWRVQPATKSRADQKDAAFVESCLLDMSVAWPDVVSEIMSMLVYGWSYHEIVYKKRKGENQDSSKNSQYTDGKIGWRKVSIRAQDTRERWEFDDKGGIKGLWQSAPPTYQLTFIPIEKALLFRTSSEKNNPEGRSVLRNAYRPFYFKRRVEEIEAIGIERDLAGFPVMYVDPEIMRSDTSAAKQQIFKDYQEMVVNIRRDQQEGLILPSMFDDMGNQLYKLDLLSSGGSRQFDINATLQRYDQRMATTVLADFILLGQQAYGSYALSSDKTNLFSVSLQTYLQVIQNVMNEYAIPRLFRVNGMPTKRLPELKYGEIETPPLTEIGTFIQQLAGAGAPLFPDDDLENHLRGMAHLPERREAAKGDVEAAGKKPPSGPAAEMNPAVGVKPGDKKATTDAVQQGTKAKPKPKPASEG